MIGPTPDSTVQPLQAKKRGGFFPLFFFFFSISFLFSISFFPITRSKCSRRPNKKKKKTGKKKDRYPHYVNLGPATLLGRGLCISFFTNALRAVFGNVCHDHESRGLGI